MATAMGLHLAAALPHLAYAAHLIGPLKYRRTIATPAVEMVDGHTAVPTGPGPDIKVDQYMLRRDVS